MRRRQNPKLWLDSCIANKTPVHIVRIPRFLQQQQEARGQGALPYAYVSTVIDPTPDDPWCQIEWFSSSGLKVEFNNYPAHCLDIYPKNNDEAFNSLINMEHYF